MLLSYKIVDFCLFYDGLLICKYEPFWQEIGVVSDTQVIVKAHGPLDLLFYRSTTRGYFQLNFAQSIQS